MSVDKSEIVRLLMAICVINDWNLMAISTHQALPERDETVNVEPHFCRNADDGVRGELQCE